MIIKMMIIISSGDEMAFVAARILVWTKCETHSKITHGEHLGKTKQTSALKIR